MKIMIADDPYETEINGIIEVLKIPLQVKVLEGSFLHIGASPSPLSEKKGSVFQVDSVPVIPATSFKGALRYQMEQLLIKKKDSFKEVFCIGIEDEKYIMPCIPAPKPSNAEKELLGDKYKGEKNIQKNYKDYCQVKTDSSKVEVCISGICPVCYFMGCAGIMGFLRINNFICKAQGAIIDHTNIRIDRNTGTAAQNAFVATEQVKAGSIFDGSVEIVIKNSQGFIFGVPRKIGNTILDKWLQKWNSDNKTQFLIDELLLPSLNNIKELGGYKSRGAGKVEVTVAE